MGTLTKKLHILKTGGTEETCNIYTTAEEVGGSPYLALEVDGQKGYVKLGSTTDANATHLRVDKDGVIYIAHLRPGSYDVTLDQLKGYLISDSRTTIQVRRELEYTVLGNIEYLIVNADQVDAAKDDTEKKDAKSDADSSENDTLGSENGTAGIDVSSWNRKIDWSKVSGSGAGFADRRKGEEFLCGKLHEAS